MKVGVYARVSGRSQALQGTSIPEQLRACRAFAKDRRDRVVDTYTDAGVSGTLLDRPELARAILDAKERRYDALVVFDLDRLARDLLVQETVIGELQRAGVEVLSLHQPDLEGDDPSRVLARQMFGAIAQYNRDMIVMRLRLGREAKRRAGGHAEGHPRYGFKVDGGKLVPDPDEQKGVALIKRMRGRRTPASWREIAAELDHRNIKPRRGGTWHPYSLSRIHKNGNHPFRAAS